MDYGDSNLLSWQYLSYVYTFSVYDPVLAVFALLWAFLNTFFEASLSGVGQGCESQRAEDLFSIVLQPYLYGHVFLGDYN